MKQVFKNNYFPRLFHGQYSVLNRSGGKGYLGPGAPWEEIIRHAFTVLFYSGSFTVLIVIYFMYCTYEISLTASSDREENASQLHPKGRWDSPFRSADCPKMREFGVRNAGKRNWRKAAHPLFLPYGQMCGQNLQLLISINVRKNTFTALQCQVYGLSYLEKEPVLFGFDDDIDPSLPCVYS